MEHICSYESHIQHLSLYHYSPTMWAEEPGTHSLYTSGDLSVTSPVPIPLRASTFILVHLSHYHSLWYSVLLYCRCIIELRFWYIDIGLHICKHDIRDTIQAILTRGHNGDMTSAIHLTNISSSILDYPLRMYTHLCSWPHGACILTSQIGHICSINSSFRSILTSFWNVYSPLFLTSQGISKLHQT